MNKELIEIIAILSALITIFSFLFNISSLSIFIMRIRSWITLIRQKQEITNPISKKSTIVCHVIRYFTLIFLLILTSYRLHFLVVYIVCFLVVFIHDFSIFLFKNKTSSNLFIWQQVKSKLLWKSFLLHTIDFFIFLSCFIIILNLWRIWNKMCNKYCLTNCR